MKRRSLASSSKALPPVGEGRISVASQRVPKDFGAQPRVGDEAGAILILAIAFLLVVSVIVAALASWTMNNLNNTLQFQHAGSRLYAAEGAMQVALRASRYTYPPYTDGTSYPCPGETPLALVNGLYVQVWCATVKPPVDLSGLTTTRIVTLTACQVQSASGTGSVCLGNAVLLSALVYLDDNDPASHLNTCSPTVAIPSACGYAMTIVSWAPGT